MLPGFIKQWFCIQKNARKANLAFLAFFNLHSMEIDFLDRFLRSFCRIAGCCRGSGFSSGCRLWSRSCLWWNLYRVVCFLRIRCGISGYERKTFFRTGIHAAAALDTIEALDGPGIFCPIYRNGTGRTISHAKTAADAVRRIQLNVAAHSFWKHSRFCRIGYGIWLRKKIFECRFCKWKKFPLIKFILFHSVTSLYS